MWKLLWLPRRSQWLTRKYTKEFDHFFASMTFNWFRDWQKGLKNIICIHFLLAYDDNKSFSHGEVTFKEIPLKRNLRLLAQILGCLRWSTEFVEDCIERKIKIKVRYFSSFFDPCGLLIILVSFWIFFETFAAFVQKVFKIHCDGNKLKIPLYASFSTFTKNL